MRTAFPAQELPVRSALTVAANCVNRTRKPVADATRFSAPPVCSSTKRNTRLSGPRSSGAKNCLNLFLVKIVGLSGAAKRYANNAKCGVIITRIGKPASSDFKHRNIPHENGFQSQTTEWIERCVHVRAQARARSDDSNRRYRYDCDAGDVGSGNRCSISLRR